MGDVAYWQCQHSKSSLQSSPCIHLHKVRAASFPLHTHTRLTPVCANITHTHTHKSPAHAASTQSIGKIWVTKLQGEPIPSSAQNCVTACKWSHHPWGHSPSISLKSAQYRNLNGEKKGKTSRWKGSDPRAEEWMGVTDRPGNKRILYSWKKSLITLYIHFHTLSRPNIIYQPFRQPPSSQVWKVKHPAWEWYERVTYKNIISPLSLLVEKWDGASLPLHGKWSDH